MGRLLDRYRELDPEWRALAGGVTAAPTLLLLALVIASVEGGLLPGACEGLGCLFSALVVLAAVTVAGTWALLWIVVRAARRRWPRSRWRLWGLRLVAVVSWGPVLWLVVLAIE